MSLGDRRATVSARARYWTLSPARRALDRAMQSPGLPHLGWLAILLAATAITMGAALAFATGE